MAAAEKIFQVCARCRRADDIVGPPVVAVVTIAAVHTHAAHTQFS